MIVVERDAIVAVRQNFGHGTIEFEQFFLSHEYLSSSATGTLQRALGAHAGAEGAI